MQETTSSNDGNEDFEFIKKREARQAKIEQIEVALRVGDVASLRNLASQTGGLLEDRLRRECWPLLLSIETDRLPPCGDRKKLRASRHYEQVKLDVDRSVKRFPDRMPEKQRRSLQDQLMDLILWVLEEEDDLHYYQGYHDICVTVLRCCGLRLGQVIAKELSKRHLRDYMCPTMDQTRILLDFIMPIIKEEDDELHDFLLESDVGTIFALSWVITWYGHVLAEHKFIVRLFDLFLALHPLMAVYTAAAMVLHCADDVLDQECDMPSVHHHLVNLPGTLDLSGNLEPIIALANTLFQKHPPSYLAKTKYEAYENCSLIKEFTHMEPAERLVVSRSTSSEKFIKLLSASLTVAGLIAVAYNYMNDFFTFL